MSQTKTSLIDLFENNELKISVLYKLYSEKIPTQKEFWEKLSQEEVLHAKDIAKRNTTATKQSLQETKFSRGVINYVTDFVDNEIKIAKTKPLSHKQALQNALRIEQSILEKKCFELFMPTDLPIKTLFHKLNRETDRHVKMLRKELKKQP